MHFILKEVTETMSKNVSLTGNRHASSEYVDIIMSCVVNYEKQGLCGQVGVK